MLLPTEPKEDAARRRHREAVARYRVKHQDREKARREKNKEYHRIKSIEWARRNPERVREIARKSAARARRDRPAHMNAIANKAYHRHKHSPVYRYHQARASARYRGLDFSLSKEEFAALIARPCTYCMADMSKFTGCGLDRLDNAVGYAAENVIPCCGSCNAIRGDKLTHDEMKVAMAAVVEFRKGAKCSEQSVGCLA